jgi:hypothetical protein
MDEVVAVTSHEGYLIIVTRRGKILSVSNLDDLARVEVRKLLQLYME